MSIICVLDALVTQARRSFLIIIRMIRNGLLSILTRNDQRRRDISVLERILRSNVSTLERTRIRRLIDLVGRRIIRILRLDRTAVGRVRRATENDRSGLRAVLRNTGLTSSINATVGYNGVRAISMLNGAIRVIYCLRTRLAYEARSSDLYLLTTNVDFLSCQGAMEYDFTHANLHRHGRIILVAGRV